MSRSDFRTLINRGRKAGLKTSELYSALSSHRPAAQDVEGGGRDGNGFLAGIDATGHQAYMPEMPKRNV